MHRLRLELKDKVRWVDIAYPELKSQDIRDYARAVLAALEESGIKKGWVLAESFGSQVAWELVRHGKGAIDIEGIILAGGFIRHPLPWGARLLKKLSYAFPRGTTNAMGIAGAFLCRKMARNEEMMEDLKSFPFDKRSLIGFGNRLALIAGNDPRETARKTDIPVYMIAGFWDFLVPLPLVWLWLKRHCPGYREGKVVFFADHAVAVSRPVETAKAILLWMGIGNK